MTQGSHLHQSEEAFAGGNTVEARGWAGAVVLRQGYLLLA